MKFRKFEKRLKALVVGHKLIVLVLLVLIFFIICILDWKNGSVSKFTSVISVLISSILAYQTLIMNKETRKLNEQTERLNNQTYELNAQNMRIKEREQAEKSLYGVHMSHLMNLKKKKSRLIRKINY